MSIGLGNIGVQQHRTPSGAPFTANSAENGTSVSTTGRIVLGNNLDDAAMPARLLSSRQIDMPSGRFIRLKKTSLSGGRTEVVEIGGIPGITYSWTGQNVDFLDISRIPIQLLAPRTATGGTLTTIQLGNSLTVNAELTHINSEAVVPKGVVLRVRNDSADAAMSNLSLETLTTNGNIYLRSGSPVATNRFRLYPSGNVLISEGAEGIADGAVRLRVRAATGQGTILFEDSAGTQIIRGFLSGNIRVGAGADSGARLQLQGVAGQDILRIDNFGGGQRLLMDVNGNLALTQLAPRSAASTVVVRNNGNNTFQGLTGASGGTFTSITSITVVDGIITAISGV